MRGFNWRAAAACVLACAALTGCASVTSAPAGLYDAPKPYQVTLGREWSDISVMSGAPSKSVRLLTIDGPLLNRLYIVGGLAPGEFMFRSMSKTQPTPTVRKEMSATERMEFITDNLGVMGYQRVEMARPRPAKFGQADGVRFDFTAKTADGLEIKGTSQVAEIDGKLYAIVYLAPAEHYFQATLPEVEKVMSSVRAGGKV
jgi:hypothetical protein